MKPTDNRIDIYPSILRLIGCILGSSLFIVAGVILLNNAHGVMDRFMGYLGMVFFSLGIVVGITWLLLIAMRKPYVRIYDDRLEYFIPARRKYVTIPFLHVEKFVIMKSGIKLISAEYSDGGFINTEINNSLVPIGKVCDILNVRLQEYRSRYK